VGEMRRIEEALIFLEEAAKFWRREHMPDK
jgi:hypothetical protein